MLTRFLRFVGARLNPHDPSAPITFGEAVERADSLVYGIRGDYNNRASAAIRQYDAVPRVEQFLAKRGWGKMRFIGAGDNAFVLQINEELALRVRGPVDPHLPQTSHTPVAPYVLPVLEEFDFDGVRLNVVPFVPLTLRTAVQNGILDQASAETTFLYLLNRGFQHEPATWFWDRQNSAGYKWEQVGFLRNGQAVIVDTGSVIYEHDTPEEAQARLRADHAIAKDFAAQHPSIASQQDWSPLTKPLSS